MLSVQGLDRGGGLVMRAHGHQAAAFGGGSALKRAEQVHVVHLSVRTEQGTHHGTITCCTATMGRYGQAARGSDGGMTDSHPDSSHAACTCTSASHEPTRADAALA
eukprot:213838-Chlamydomonas_euryale.AAC.6